LEAHQGCADEVCNNARVINHFLKLNGGGTMVSEQIGLAA